MKMPDCLCRGLGRDKAKTGDTIRRKPHENTIACACSGVKLAVTGALTQMRQLRPSYQDHLRSRNPYIRVNIHGRGLQNAVGAGRHVERAQDLNLNPVILTSDPWIYPSCRLAQRNTSYSYRTHEDCTEVSFNPATESYSGMQPTRRRLVLTVFPACHRFAGYSNSPPTPIRRIIWAAQPKATLLEVRRPHP